MSNIFIMPNFIERYNKVLTISRFKPVYVFKLNTYVYIDLYMTALMCIGEH